MESEINILADKISKHPLLKIFERTESPGVNPEKFQTIQGQIWN